ncbi:pirin family protein [Aquisalinus flavus]|uniref:Quercetin 2,3-dioxygenase n=1 Tax=Aquisalinus flavus TaxID=1526572 RepID=A0A8J2V6B3_9PROT|nr:pirin family protein [Aquisalinus flavus]MBD0425423.1 pirin family protein [Aquisalinus flavus]UNE48936.1 pirin family protein [Aquisalinus flavus]GGD16196.1 quercetin 2,3-dioxygenase [Aquisalinus flavus]
MTRTIARQYPSDRDDIADLVTRRPLPGQKVSQVDPFLFLNHHGPQTYKPNNNGLPFGPHPHRGFETVTFILDGSLAHHDTGGHESIIEAGGVQWMTAGSGLVHAELSPAAFKRDGGDMEILQLWVNLPSKLKMTEPRYTGVQADGIPHVPVADGDGTLHLVSGDFDGQAGPVDSLTGVFMSWVDLKDGASVTLPAPAARNIFFYMVSGNAEVAGTEIKEWYLVEFNGDGDQVTLTAKSDCRFLFGHADKIGEPVVAHGPFVMNTHQEINEAIRDYQAGKFDRQPLNL